MSRVIIKCSNTGREIFTGIEADDVSSIPGGPSYTRCPLCGEDHSWSREDARLAEDAAGPIPEEQPYSALPSYETVREKLW